MDIKAIKSLAEKHSQQELENFAKDLEEKGLVQVKTQDDLGDQLSDYLQAMEVKKLMDQGMALNEAVREFSKRVRGVLS